MCSEETKYVELFVVKTYFFLGFNRAGKTREKNPVRVSFPRGEERKKRLHKTHADIRALLRLHTQYIFFCRTVLSFKEGPYHISKNERAEVWYHEPVYIPKLIGAAMEEEGGIGNIKWKLFPSKKMNPDGEDIFFKRRSLYNIFLRFSENSEKKESPRESCSPLLFEYFSRMM